MLTAETTKPVVEMQLKLQLEVGLRFKGLFKVTHAENAYPNTDHH